MRLLVGATPLRKLSLVLVLVLAAACSGEDPSSSGPTRRDCAALRDRMVALRLASVTADRAQHEANLRAALGAEFVDGCVQAMPLDEVRCALDAADVEALLACGSRAP